MARQSLFEHVVVRARWRTHEGNTTLLEPVVAGDQIIAGKSDVLDAFALVLAKVLFNLTDLLGLFLIQRNTDQAIGRCQGA